MDTFTKHAGKANSGFGFAAALIHLKDGGRVARHGWLGKGMWIALTPGSSFASRYATDGHATKFRAEEGAEKIDLLPHIDMRAADGAMVIGWLASQADLLAEDWYVVE